MALLAEPADELVLEGISRVISGEGNAHGFSLAAHSVQRHWPNLHQCSH
jgi:hypothetical protein